MGAARRFDDRPLAAAALVVRAFAGALVGPIREAQADCTEAAQLVDSLADDQLAHGLAAVSFLSAAEFYLERYDAVAAHVERGLAVARATGQGDFVPSLAQALGNVLFVTGRLAEAGEVLDSAVEATRLSDNPVALAWTLLNRAYAAVLAGDVDLALRASEECVSLTRGLESSVVAAWAAAARAAALFEAGAAERAAATLVAAAGGDELPLIPGGWRANWLEFLTRCFLALQRPADAQRAAANAKARADAFGLLLARGIADRALAAVALDAGDAGTAVERALASAAACEQAGARVDAALSRALAGRALAHAGDVARAVAELERSADELEACGAARSREKAERELRGLGRKIPRRRRPGKPGEHGIESLSGRELDVARLVVDRRTNREIAAELFLSRKTVETHLRNIFRKLDAGSRVEVARIVERGQAR